MTEDISAHASSVKDLRVISRTSVMVYERTAKSIREIAQELNVDTVLEGSVHHAGNKVRIVAQLIVATIGRSPRSADGHLLCERVHRVRRSLRR